MDEKPIKWTCASADESARDQLAERLLQLAPLIRRRVRERLSLRARRLFDSQDLLSTVLRRVDRLAAASKLRAQTDAQLVSLVLTVLDNAIVDRHRAIRRLERLEGEDGRWALRFADELRKRNETEGDDLLAAMFASLESEDERLLLSLRLGGAPHAVIASMLDVSDVSVRKRWQSLKHRLERVHLVEKSSA